MPLTASRQVNQPFRFPTDPRRASAHLDHRNERGSTAGSGRHQLPCGPACTTGQFGGIALSVVEGCFDDIADGGLHLGVPLPPLVGVHPAAALDERRLGETAPLAIDDYPHQDEPLAGQGAPLVDQVLAQRPTAFIDHHVLVGDPADRLEAVVREPDLVAIGASHDPVGRHPPLQRQPVVGNEVGVLAMNRDEQFRIG